jgi:hypothetical protein
MSNKSEKDMLVSDERITKDCPYGQSSAFADQDWMDGAKYTRTIYEAELTKLRAERNELVGALEDLRKYVKRAPFGTLTEADRVLAKHKPE